MKRSKLYNGHVFVEPFVGLQLSLTRCLPLIRVIRITNSGGEVSRLHAGGSAEVHLL